MHPMRTSPNCFLKSILTSSFALAAVAFTSHALAIQVCELNGESIDTYNGNSTKGKTGLVRCKDKDTGVVQRETELKNGVWQGVSRYFDKGKLSKEYQQNERGNHDGLSREFSPEGKVIREETYVNGTNTGLSRTWYPSGQLRRVTWYADGEKAYVELNEQGQVYGIRCGDKAQLSPAFDDVKACGFSGGPSKVEVYNGKGMMRAKLSFDSGKRVRNEELYENGKPSLVTEIKGDQRTDRRWNESGTLVHETFSQIMTERFTVKLIEKEFADSGALTHEQRWNTNADRLLDQTFYLNGQPKTKSVYSIEGGKHFNDEIEFSDAGQRVSQGRYILSDRNGSNPIGIHQSFDDHGTLIAESTYENNGKLTRERTWDATGTLKRDDAVFEDGSRKAFAK
jgi:antitoxin component YwqK of YwqJK toxin-antitoxin module